MITTMKMSTCSLIFAFFVYFPIAIATAFGQQFSIASVSSAGVQGNASSTAAGLSSDGRFVAFESGANNLVAGDTNAFQDVFVRDLQTGQTTRVSVSSAGVQGNLNSYVGAISADGRIVSFRSDANNLVAGDTNGYPDVFVHDRQTSTTTRVSVSSLGQQANNGSYGRTSSLSADGQIVAFHSAASNLVVGDTNNRDDVFVHDRQTGITTRESVGTGGVQGDYSSSDPSLSADGRYIAFSSQAQNFVTGYISWDQVYWRDRTNNNTELASISSPYDPVFPGANNPCWTPSISADGSTVVFASPSSNMFANDNNFTTDLYVRKMSNGYVDCVSVTPQGNTGNSTTYLYAVISGDGRYVLFQSQSKDLVPETAGGSLTKSHWFRRDLVTGQTLLLTKTPAGLPANQNYSSAQPAGLSFDGQTACFETDANNLGPTDLNGSFGIDIYVYRSAPVAQSVFPPCGPLAGGTNLNITGQSFGEPGSSITVTIGGSAATNISILSSTTLTCLAPAGTAGAKDIVVSTSTGTASLINGYTHTANLEVYGTGTPGCFGTQEISATALPKIGEANFGFAVDNCPASSLGLMLVTDSQDAGGSDPFGLGVLFHIDLIQATEILPYDIVSDADGRGSCSSPVPQLPALIGTSWYAQTFWVWSNCPIPPLDLSSSQAMRITIEP